MNFQPTFFFSSPDQPNSTPITNPLLNLNISLNQILYPQTLPTLLEPNFLQPYSLPLASWGFEPVPSFVGQSSYLFGCYPSFSPMPTPHIPPWQLQPAPVPGPVLPDEVEELSGSRR